MRSSRRRTCAELGGAVAELPIDLATVAARAWRAFRARGGGAPGA